MWKSEEKRVEEGTRILYEYMTLEIMVDHLVFLEFPWRGEVIKPLQSEVVLGPGRSCMTSSVTLWKEGGQQPRKKWLSKGRQCRVGDERKKKEAVRNMLGSTEIRVKSDIGEDSDQCGSNVWIGYSRFLLESLKDLGCIKLISIWLKGWGIQKKKKKDNWNFKILVYKFWSNFMTLGSYFNTKNVLEYIYES